MEFSAAERVQLQRSSVNYSIARPVGLQWPMEKRQCFVLCPGKLALVSLQPMPIDPWETVPQPQAWNTLEIDFQPGSPAEIQWCEAPEL